jgi:predicted nucleotide-binding protein (sugar kinase/HSP70/actin superfamily)
MSAQHLHSIGIKMGHAILLTGEMHGHGPNHGASK